MRKVLVIIPLAMVTVVATVFSILGMFSATITWLITRVTKFSMSLFLSLNLWAGFKVKATQEKDKADKS